MVLWRARGHLTWVLLSCSSFPHKEYTSYMYKTHWIKPTMDNLEQERSAAKESFREVLLQLTARNMDLIHSNRADDVVWWYDHPNDTAKRFCCCCKRWIGRKRQNWGNHIGWHHHSDNFRWWKQGMQDGTWLESQLELTVDWYGHGYFWQKQPKKYPWNPHFMPGI